jgi:hypothetical protein
MQHRIRAATFLSSFLRPITATAVSLLASSAAARMKPLTAGCGAAALIYLVLGAVGVEVTLPAAPAASADNGNEVVVLRTGPPEPALARSETTAVERPTRGRTREDTTSIQVSPRRSSAESLEIPSPSGGAAAPAEAGAPQSDPAGADPSTGNPTPPRSPAPTVPPTSPPPPPPATSELPPLPTVPTPPAPPPPPPLPHLPPPLPLPQTPPLLHLPPVPPLPHLPCLP